MKKLALLAALFAAMGALTGCGPHATDITDDVAAIVFPTAWA